ncbi:MAG: AAA family ATPase [Planctomycetota bacterium]|jgi:hypothetical protein
MLERYTHRTATELKRDRSALVDILKEAGAMIRGNNITCPLCDDKHPSAGIYNGDGNYRYKCHKCNFNGSVIDVIARLDGIDASEVFKRLRNDSQQQKPTKVYQTIEEMKQVLSGQVEDVYQYTNPATGKPDMIVFRYITPDGKSFSQARPVENGFVFGAPLKPWPLYNRKRLEQAPLIVVVEGEGKVHALHKYGFVGTTAPCGALKGEYADWTPLTGKNVILWPDNDKPGQEHMHQVEEILRDLEPAPNISLIKPDELDLSSKQDVVDFIQQQTGDIQTAILNALDTAKSRGIANEVGEIIRAGTEGRREAIDWPWSEINQTQALIPGTVTILCGGVGASKSFMLLEAAAFWHNKGIPIAVFELEDDKTYHLIRCLAQKAELSDITNIRWQKEHPIEAMNIFEKHKGFLDSFGKCIYSSRKQPTLKEVAKWVEDKAKTCRIIAVDPVTIAAHKGEAIWKEDDEFLDTVKRAAVKNECSVILITHPVKGVSNPDVNQLAGGAAYQRFAHSILWLESHEPKTGRVKMVCGTTEAEYNRTLHILKARNGRGLYKKIVCEFQSDGLRLKEIGSISRKQE